MLHTHKISTQISSLLSSECDEIHLASWKWWKIAIITTWLAWKEIASMKISAFHKVCIFQNIPFFMNSTLVDTLDKSSDNFLSNSFINFKMKSTLYNITTKVQHFSRNHVRCGRIVTILCWCCKSYFAKKISKITALKVFTASKAGS